MCRQYQVVSPRGMVSVNPCVRLCPKQDCVLRCHCLRFPSFVPLDVRLRTRTTFFPVCTEDECVLTGVFQCISVDSCSLFLHPRKIHGPCSLDLWTLIGITENTSLYLYVLIRFSSLLSSAFSLWFVCSVYLF